MVRDTYSWPTWCGREASAGVLTLEMCAHHLSLLPGFAQALHGRGKLGLGLGQLVGQFGFALLQIRDRLISSLFCLVKLLCHPVKLAHFGLIDSNEPMHKPVCKPSKTERHEQNDRCGDDEFSSVHLGCRPDQSLVMFLLRCLARGFQAPFLCLLLVRA